MWSLIRISAKPKIVFSFNFKKFFQINTCQISTEYGVDGVVESDSDSGVDVRLSSPSIDFVNGSVPFDSTNSGSDLGVSVSGVSDFRGGDS